MRFVVSHRLSGRTLRTRDMFAVAELRITADATVRKRKYTNRRSAIQTLLRTLEFSPFLLPGLWNSSGEYMNDQKLFVIVVKREKTDQPPQNGQNKLRSIPGVRIQGETRNRIQFQSDQSTLKELEKSLKKIFD